jgi:hypothetical protein
MPADGKDRPSPKHHPGVREVPVPSYGRWNMADGGSNDVADLMVIFSITGDLAQK